MSETTTEARMLQPKTYEANCHCGLIKYTVKLDDALAPEGAGKIGNCNCSICTKNGYLLVYPRREDVKFLDDSESKLRAYFFGAKSKPHKFCPECGSSVLIDFKDSRIDGQRPLLAMNTRLFKGINYDKAVFSHFDGMSKLDPPYCV